MFTKALEDLKTAGAEIDRRHHHRAGAAAAGRRHLPRIQVRHERLSGDARPERTGALAGGDCRVRQVRSVSSGRLKSAPTGTPGPAPTATRARPKRRIATPSARRSPRSWTSQKLDALVYPTWSHPPRLIGGNAVADRRQQSGLLAHVRLPRHHGADGLHARRAAAGRHDDSSAARGMKPRLIKLGYSYEQATKHRRPPASTPPLK